MNKILQFLLLSILLFSTSSVLAHHQKVTIKSGDVVYQGTGYREFGVDQLALYSTRGKAKDSATISAYVPAGNGRFDIRLFTVGESIGQSTFTLKIGDKVVGSFTTPKTSNRHDDSAGFVATFKQVEINEGEKFSVTGENGSHDGKSFSSAIWSKIEFTQLDHDPGKAMANMQQFRTMDEIEAGPKLVSPRLADGSGKVEISGTLQQWHDVVLTLDGPFAHEQDIEPNPFLDYRMSVTFTHESGAPSYTVPGYFATDGNAGETSAEAGNKWRAHVSPDKTGLWYYRISFVKGEDAAVEPATGEYLAPYQGTNGSFVVAKTNKTGVDFRAKGRLTYVGGHYLRHAGNGEHFLKIGTDAPETLLAYVDFDNTVAAKPTLPLKTWQAHGQDAKPNDPTWQNGKGKNLLGALNYLADKGLNAFSFLTYNAAGDGDNIWPYVERNGKFHFDTSKLDQWGYVFSHAQQLGLYLHFKLQENENDDNRKGAKRLPTTIVESLDGGLLGKERKLYLRELIARYGHHLALNWNLGEENTQSYQEQTDMAEYILNLDAYDHNLIIHSFPNQQDELYLRLIGSQSVLTGVSLQNSWRKVHQQTLRWVDLSRAAGKPWIVANDEQNPAGMGVPPDPGYQGFNGWAEDHEQRFNVHDIRKLTLWGNLMAGGAGVEYYFGYRLKENDLLAQDFRSRDMSWHYCALAVAFFKDNNIPFWQMQTDNALVGNPENTNSRFAFAKQGEVYVVYLPEGGEAKLDLSDVAGQFSVKWYDPRNGGDLHTANVSKVNGGKVVSLGLPPKEPKQDWAVLVRKQ